jgi:transcriptional regulator with AAA-type ATPase domain
MKLRCWRPASLKRRPRPRRAVVEEGLAEDLRNAVDRLIRDLYHPFDEAVDLVRCFAEAALTATEAYRTEITIRSARDTAELRVSLEPGRPRRTSTTRNAVFPIRYQTAELGGLAVFSPALSLSGAGAKACERIAETLAYHLKRHEVHCLARERYGREVSFIGTSEPLTRVDRFLERASQNPLPALLLGSPGSRVETLALALHLLGPSWEGAFVQANCATLENAIFEPQLTALLRRAAGGTLLLARLEQLDPRSQDLLCQILEIGLAPWTANRCGQPAGVRLIATASHELEGMAQRGQFCPFLFEQLDFLRLEVEPLRNRREDIPPLIEYYLRRHASGRVPEVSAEVLEACMEYDWPGDVSELSRVVARLAVLTGDEQVLPQHVRDHAPQILEAKQCRSPASNEGLPCCTEARHPSLLRAIEHITGHFQENLSLAGVAAEAYVSSSHLAHLFKQDLGTSFTRFLAGLRVDRGKRLLAEQPRESITFIAAEVGFSDLRHFERTFKSVVGCTPKEYRKLSGLSRSPRQIL